MDSEILYSMRKTRRNHDENNGICRYAGRDPDSSRSHSAAAGRDPEQDAGRKEGREVPAICQGAEKMRMSGVYMPGKRASKPRFYVCIWPVFFPENRAAAESSRGGPPGIAYKKGVVVN